jgi:NosR/NirI family transcriptional regulator, nitrous oxide reductase regulator
MDSSGWHRRAWRACILLAGLVGIAAPEASVAATLAERVTPEIQELVYPNADRLAPAPGASPALVVYKGSELVGYIFSTLDVVAAPGYYGIPFDVIVGVTLDGTITGAKVIDHHEPYIVSSEIRQLQLDKFLGQHAGSSTKGGNVGMLPPDFVTGATVSARAMRAGIYDAARIVLKERAPRLHVTVPTLDLDGFVPKPWDALLAQGSIVSRRVTNREAAAALEQAGGPGTAPDVAFGARPDDVYIEVFTGLATPPGVGRNLVGAAAFNIFQRPILAGSQVIAVGSTGPYSFLGPRNYRSGQTFDNVRLVQGEGVIELSREKFIWLAVRDVAPGQPAQHYAALFTLAPGTQFEPLSPWRLEILINGTDRQGKAVSAVVPVEYRLPSVHVLMPEVEPPPAWIEAWEDSRTDVAILGAALVLLTLILAFQSRLVRHRRAHRWVRNGFLAFVVVWLGWIAQGQLSIINVANYLMAPVRGFDLGFYLAEPIMVVIAVYTAISLLLLGRGVFCGWLCPFGALQELLAQAARALQLPQWNPSEGLQRRLWMVKYAAAALVLGLGFADSSLATGATEIEPFKTAITAHFARAWPFVVYAAAFLTVGLFSERAYCRFLCPLGGTLALLSRLHVVDLLRRRPECGSPCHLCEASCPVKAIARSGEIQTAECFQCLDCQVEYYDDERCPPLAKTRKLRVA